MNQHRAIEAVIERLDQSLWDTLDVVAYKTVIPHLILLFSVLDGDRPF
ncbi:hypothetical protein [Aeromonas caviae]|nr:hypothetical protein [Aeromonas caviae]